LAALSGGELELLKRGGGTFIRPRLLAEHLARITPEQLAQYDISRSGVQLPTAHIESGDEAWFARIEPPRPTGEHGRPILRRGMANDFVRAIQIKLHVNQTGTFDSATETAVRDLQRARNMVADGIVGAKTWAAIDELTESPPP
jgi:peptidoglycan hydrolase-like protein with peptidoglycan-binding domain